MNLPRVCIVSEIFHPEDQGGQGRQAFELARQLIRQGVPVRVVTRRNFDGSSRHEVIDGIDITRLPPTGLLKGRGWAAIPRTLYFLAGLFWHLIRHRAAYDVLFVQGVKGVLIPTFAATALCGKPYVIKIDALAELQHALTSESLARMAVESNFEAVAARHIDVFKQVLGGSGAAGRWNRWQPWLRRAGMLALLLAAGLVWAGTAAFDSVLHAVASKLSPDGVLTASGQARVASFLAGSALSATMIGILLLALSRERWRGALGSAVEWDALGQRGLRVPNPYAVLLGATGLALLLIALWTLRARLGKPVLFLFAKEGPLEQATFVLELAGAMLCAVAAIRWNPLTAPHSMVIRGLYALCAFGLFVVAMEEINWGQTFFGFQTPASWAAINYQQETSLHNLMDRDELNWASHIVAMAFGVGVLGMILWTARAPRSLISAIAPHASLAPLALVVVYAGARLHQEILELLLAMFFVFYSWRIYVAARSSSGGEQDRLVVLDGLVDDRGAVLQQKGAERGGDGR